MLNRLSRRSEDEQSGRTTCTIKWMDGIRRTNKPDPAVVGGSPSLGTGPEYVRPRLPSLAVRPSHYRSSGTLDYGYTKGDGEEAESELSLASRAATGSAGLSLADLRAGVVSGWLGWHPSAQTPSVLSSMSSRATLALSERDASQEFRARSAVLLRPSLRTPVFSASARTPFPAVLLA